MEKMMMILQTHGGGLTPGHPCLQQRFKNSAAIYSSAQTEPTDYEDIKMTTLLK